MWECCTLALCDGISSSILVTECWARSWCRCIGTQPSGDFLSHLPAVGCHYFPPGLQLPSQLKNVTVLRPVPSYTAWWQKHIGVNDLPRLLCSFVLVRIERSPYDFKSNALPLHHRATYSSLCDGDNVKILRIFLYMKTTPWFIKNFIIDYQYISFVSWSIL